MSAISLIAGRVVRLSPKRKVKKPKLEIDLNNPFYSAKFDPCKKTRPFNPVELVKAQAFSAHMFRKCGPKMIVRLATKWRFPAWGIMPLTRLGCVAIHMAFGFLASDGTIIMPDSTKSSEVFHLVNYYWPALDKSGYKVVLKSGNATYTFPNEAIWELADEGLACLLDTTYVEETDGDYYKHSLNHVRFMLL